MDTRYSGREELLWLDQISKGFRSLHFDEPLETQFRLANRQDNLCQLRCALALVTLLANAWFGFRSSMLTSVTPYLSATFFIYFCFCLRFWQAVAVSSAMFAGYAVMTLATAVHIGFGTLNNILLLLLPNLVGALGAYNLEFSQRQRFLMEWELKYQANHDQLTGLWNRRALQEHSLRAWAHCNREQQPLSLALIDIDYFKLFNDSYGHIRGDQCLAEVGRLLRATGQRPLDLVARYGGEEFAVLLPNCNAEQANRILQQFRQSLAAQQLPHRASYVPSQVTASIGLVTMLPKQNTVDFNRLINGADKALYDAKARGRDCVVMIDETQEPLPSNVKVLPRARYA